MHFFPRKDWIFYIGHQSISFLWDHYGIHLLHGTHMGIMASQVAAKSSVCSISFQDDIKENIELFIIGICEGPLVWKEIFHWPLLLTWFNFNPSMYK